jgi:hypothetical protein
MLLHSESNISLPWGVLTSLQEHFYLFVVTEHNIERQSTERLYVEKNKK